MAEEIKLPEWLIQYTQYVARNGISIRYICSDDVKELRRRAMEAIAAYREARKSYEEKDREQLEAQEWLASMGIPFESASTNESTCKS